MVPKSGSYLKYIWLKKSKLCDLSLEPLKALVYHKDGTWGTPLEDESCMSIFGSMPFFKDAYDCDSAFCVFSS